MAQNSVTYFMDGPFVHKEDIFYCKSSYVQLISVKVEITWRFSPDAPAIVSHHIYMPSGIVPLSPLHFGGIIHLSRHRRRQGFPGSYGDDYMQNTT